MKKIFFCIFAAVSFFVGTANAANGIDGATGVSGKIDGVPDEKQVAELLLKKLNAVSVDYKSFGLTIDGEFSIDKVFQIGRERQYVIIRKNIKQPNTLLGETGYFDGNGKFVTTKVIKLTNNLDKLGTGSLEVTNLATSERFVIELKNGTINVASSEDLISDDPGTILFSLCQKQPGETFKQCFKRVSDDFCDDFVSTVAYYTNPSIPIMIAAMCTC
ncbi:MAG: hypothetical protein FWD66_03730 [Paludibacter sp.]|nr:hypothetical protein [Paludibacter sp.]